MQLLQYLDELENLFKGFCKYKFVEIIINE
jgi:hypothetical protein